MTARQIASHRYAGHELPQSSVQFELAAEYRKLLTTDEENTAKLGNYVKLIPQLLECKSAHLLFVLDAEACEISRHDPYDRIGPLPSEFARHVGKSKVHVANNVSLDRDKSGMEWLQALPELGSYLSSNIQISDLSLCLLVAIDDKARMWTDEDTERLQDVTQMLSSSLEVARERQLISVQRRMQRSLVQFVRGNLNTSEDVQDGGQMQTRTGSLYSDLDEDLEADDADDETEPYETSRMNVMFDFSARLIRRTLKISGCVLINIENLTDLANIQADIPLRSTIMGACFLKHLRSKEWHEVRSAENSIATKTRSTLSADTDELQTKDVERQDVFDPRGLAGSWLKDILEAHPRAVAFNEKNLPDALITLLPLGVKSCLLSPIYDSNAKAFALIVAFHDKVGEFSKADCHYIEAFGSSIYAEVLNQSLQKANEAKALFISKISHEFRTPLHGILASAEFLNDMSETTPGQAGFIETIDTCGRTLLDIINHVLDYSKLSFSKNVLAKDATSSNVVAMEDFDVVEVAEQVLATVFSSYEFKRINEHVDVQKSSSQPSQQSDSSSGRIWEALGRNLEVIVLAEFRPEGYIVHSDLGAFRRIVMNLLGNALKYTRTGHVVLEIKLNSSKDSALNELSISVTDTGIGIASSFLAEMFRPFSQEDEFSAGTGLGLSIVKELCNKLHGAIDVQSRKRRGSTFKVIYPVILAAAKPTLFPGAGFRRDLQNVKFYYPDAGALGGDGAVSQVEARATDLLRTSIIDCLKSWYGMQEADLHTAELLLTDDLVTPENGEDLKMFEGAILTFCSTTAKYERNMRRRSLPLQVFVTKPCGPQRLGAWVTDCLNKVRNISRMSVGGDSPDEDSISPRESIKSPNQTQHSSSPSWSLPSTVQSDQKSRTNITGGSRRTIREEQVEQNLAEMYAMHTLSPAKLKKLKESPADVSPDSAAAEDLWETPRDVDTSRFDPAASHPPSSHDPKVTAQSGSVVRHRSKSHILIVEDNPVNMMLLVAFAKRQHLSVTTAVNGAIAVECVKNRPEPFDAILMDINMPVMNGFQAMKAIRKYERNNRSESTKIVALTGLSTPEDQARASEAGANEFFTKPVKMALLRELFVKWQVLSPDQEG